MSPSEVSSQLRQAGLRVTRPRESVLQWLAEHPHATVEQIRSGVAQVLGSVSTQAVYDVLAACTDAGWSPPVTIKTPSITRRRDGSDHYAARADDNRCWYPG